MYTLFIDTHFEILHVALFQNELVFDEILKNDGRHSEYFVNSLKELLERNSLTIHDLSGIIVVNGPGSFTGVRIGVVVAKLISYCEHIPIKVISSLQAVALKYDEDCVIGIKDKNGAFIGKFNKSHELMGDYFYLNNKELDDFKENIIIDDVINLDMVYDYLKDKKDIEPHIVKPIYVKKIEVDKWLENQMY